MARIADEELVELKASISLERLVASSGVELKPHGQDRIGLCPFHDDKTPSLVVSPATNLWHCLGACQTGGSVIDWVMRSQGVSFRHAVEILKGDPSVLAASPVVKKKPIKRTRTHKLNSELTGDAGVLLNQVIDYYHETLLAIPEALDYLKQRGLDDMDLIRQFKLGYANRTLGYRLPEKNRKAGAEMRGNLQDLGILRSSGHEHFNGSLVVPVYRGGQVVEVYGRKLLSNLRKGTPRHLYLPGAHAGVWNAEGLVNQAEVILCEALIDAMTFWVSGYKNVTASYGVSGFTDAHLDTFKQLNIQRVLIAYDRDEAGQTAAEALARKLHGEGLSCYRLHFPKGMDANAYALNVTPASRSLGVVIRSAEPMLRAIPRIEPGSAESTKAAKSKPLNPPHTVADDNTPSSLATEPKSPILPAAAQPPAPTPAQPPEITDHDVQLVLGDRHYRIRGLTKNTSYEVLKVNVLVRMGETNPRVHVDTFDLYSAKHRQSFGKLAAVECGIEAEIIQRDLGQVLLQLEALQDAAIQAALAPKMPSEYTMSEDEHTAALALLTDPHLTSRIIEDFTHTGLVGEPANALMGYLATVSRKLNAPLAIIVQSTSAAGKSALMDAVLKLVPIEDRVHYSAMTGQSLFYLGETNLKHKILGIAEEEGVRQAAYALKLLQSQGELTIASTGKDPQSGKLVTEEYRVEGPVMLFLTTTAIDIDEELMNRCVVLTINESREQTAAIQARQRQSRTLQGLLANTQADEIIQQHQNAQRLLKPLVVVNPYAEQLKFADSRTRTRRDHEKYLTLIEAIALLHQYQRPIKQIEQAGQGIEYIEVSKADITLANQLAHELLGRSLDELPPPTRSLLKHLHTLVADKVNTKGLRQHEVRFTRKEIREACGLSHTQVGVHLMRLVELEYVYAHYGRNGQRYVYELVFDGVLEQNGSQLAGLIEANALTDITTDNLTAKSRDQTECLRPASGAHPAHLRTHEHVGNASATNDLATKEGEKPASDGLSPLSGTNGRGRIACPTR